MDYTVILNWLAENWIWLSILLLTEALPFLPTEANGIAQFALNVLKKVKPVAALGLIVFILAGCTTINPVVNLPPGATGATYSITINADKYVNTNPTLTTRDVTVPVK